MHTHLKRLEDAVFFALPAREEKTLHALYVLPRPQEEVHVCGAPNHVLHTVRSSFIQLSDLRQCGCNEIVQILKQFSFD